LAEFTPALLADCFGTLDGKLPWKENISFRKAGGKDYLKHITLFLTTMKPGVGI